MNKFSEIRIKMQNYSFMKMHLKMPSAKWGPFCPGGEDLKLQQQMYWQGTVTLYTYIYFGFMCDEGAIFHPWFR